MKQIIIALLLSSQIKAQQAKIPVVSHPRHMAIDSKGNLYVTMKYGIARIAPDGSFTDLRKLEGGRDIDIALENAGGLVIDSKDNLFLAAEASIFKIRVSENRVEKTNYAGVLLNWKYGIDDGPVATAKIQVIDHMTIDKYDNLYISQSWDWIRNNSKDLSPYITDNYIRKVPTDKVSYFFKFFRKISPDGIVSTIKSPDGKYMLANGVEGFAVDTEGNIIYTSTQSRSVEKINVSKGTISHIAGKSYKRQYCPVYTIGDTSKAELFAPGFMIMDKNGGIIYSDTRSHRITKIANGKVSTLAGNNIIQPCALNIGGRAREGHKDGKATIALFNFPRGMVYDSKGNLYIADQHNMCIRKLSPEGIVSSFTTFDRSQAMIENY